MSSEEQPDPTPQIPPPAGRVYDWTDLDHDPRWIYDNPEYDE